MISRLVNELTIQYNPISTTTIGPRKCGQINDSEVVELMGCSYVMIPSLCKLYHAKYGKTMNLCAQSNQ